MTPKLQYGNREPRGGGHSNEAAGGGRDSSREHGGGECVSKATRGRGDGA